jgi:XTP/dITP diphosphohydrolase
MCVDAPDMTKTVTKIVLASGNPGKLRELKALLDQSLSHISFSLAPEGFDPQETGSTFGENALIKARAAAQLTGCISLADDSGICVSALNGAPGIRSARYAPGTDADRRIKLLEALADVPDDKRQAYFACALAVVDGEGKLLYAGESHWHGKIAKSEAGANGFGYDSIFIPDSLDETSAQIDPETKNRMSHRGMAFAELKKHLLLSL